MLIKATLKLLAVSGIFWRQIFFFGCYIRILWLQYTFSATFGLRFFFFFFCESDLNKNFLGPYSDSVTWIYYIITIFGKYRHSFAVIANSYRTRWRFLDTAVSVTSFYIFLNLILLLGQLLVNIDNFFAVSTFLR